METTIRVKETELDCQQYVRAYLGGKALGEGAYGLTSKILFAESRDDPQEQLRTAALKILKPFDRVKTTANVDPVTDFQEEIDFLKRLRHPGVVRVLKNGRCTITLEDGTKQDTAYHICEFEENTVGLDKVIENPFGDDGHRYGVRFLSTLMVRILVLP